MASASAWLPWVEPATEKRHQSAPHSARGPRLGVGQHAVGAA